jgi:hypothetical protein
MYVMGRRLDKEKLGLRASETLIHYQESQFTISIGVEASPSRPKPNEEKVVIETPEKLKGLRTKSVPRYTNKFSANSEVDIMIRNFYHLHPDHGAGL